MDAAALQGSVDTIGASLASLRAMFAGMSFARGGPGGQAGRAEGGAAGQQPGGAPDASYWVSQVRARLWPGGGGLLG